MENGAVNTSLGTARDSGTAFKGFHFPPPPSRTPPVRWEQTQGMQRWSLETERGRQKEREREEGREDMGVGGGQSNMADSGSGGNSGDSKQVSSQLWEKMSEKTRDREKRLEEKEAKET